MEVHEEPLGAPSRDVGRDAPPYALERRQVPVIHHLGNVRFVHLIDSTGQGLLLEEVSGAMLTNAEGTAPSQAQIDSLVQEGTMRRSLDLRWNEAPPAWLDVLVGLGHRVDAVGVIEMRYALPSVMSVPPMEGPDADGRIGPSMTDRGRKAAVARWTALEAGSIDPKAAKRLLQCEIMDLAHVPNGSKAIAIALNRHWGEALTAVFGPADSPRSVRRWRASRGRPGDRRIADMVASSGTGPFGRTRSERPEGE